MRFTKENLLSIKQDKFGGLCKMKNKTIFLCMMHQNIHNEKGIGRTIREKSSSGEIVRPLQEDDASGARVGRPKVRSLGLIARCVARCLRRPLQGVRRRRPKTSDVFSYFFLICIYKYIPFSLISHTIFTHLSHLTQHLPIKHLSFTHSSKMYACIILHNMIIHDEGPRADDWSDNEAESSASHATSPVIRGLAFGVSERLQAEENMRSRQTHLQLMSDMVEEVWACRGR